MSRPQPLCRSSADIEPDPITLQVIRHELVAVPNQIEKNVERTAFSPLVQEYKDYSVGFVDPSGRLVAQSRGSLPIFVANALGAAVREGLQIHGVDSLADGDIIISNTAAVLGQHLNNVVAYTPVRVAGTLAGFFAVLVHWIDVGGAVPGSCQSTTTTERLRSVFCRTIRPQLFAGPGSSTTLTSGIGF